MNITFKDVLLIFLIIFAFVQVCLNNILIKKIHTKSVTVKEIKKHKDLTQIYKEICELNNTSISNADKKNGIWCIELKISGDKHDILEEIKKLEKYEINNYIINKNNTENYIILNVCGSEWERIW